MVSKTKSLAIIFVGLMLGQTANAKAMTSQEVLKLKDVIIYKEPVTETEKTTDWYATPVSVMAENAKTRRPEAILFFVESTGYYGAFANHVQINCVNPSESFVKIDNNKNISLKTSMAFEENPYDENFEYRMDRKAVEGIFAKFCK